MPVGTCVYCGAPIFSDEPHTTDSDGARRCKSHPEDLDAVSGAGDELYAVYALQRRLADQVREADAMCKAARGRLRRAYEDAGRVVPRRPGRG